MIPTNITKDHLVQAIEEIDKDGIPKGRQSFKYDLDYNEKNYPPLLVVSYANRIANGEEFPPNTLGGGPSSEAFKLLKKEGFQVNDKKSALTQTEIKNGVELLCKTSSEVEGFYQKDVNIIDALNDAQIEDLKQCASYYSSRKGVVIDIRKELINRLIEKEVFSVESLHELIERFKKGKERQFRSYKETFSIVFPAITFYGHNRQRNFVESFTSKLINDLSVKNNIKEVSFDFQGVRQQGSDRYWVAIYNKEQESQSKGIQFFFEFYQGKIGYGVYRHSNKTFIKPRKTLSPKEFNYKEMLNYFSDSKELLLADVPNENGLSEITDKLEKTIEMKFPLNTILYGPPGTGKTYNTILRAAQIIEKRSIESYDEALEIFKANLHNRIEFITFHQNYSYEDFIQGLRPETDNASELLFEKKDGVFKRIADRAKASPYFVPVGTKFKDYTVIKSNKDIVELWSEKTESIRYVPYQLIKDLMDGITSNKISIEDIKKRRNLNLPALLGSKVEKYFFGIESTLYSICEFLIKKKEAKTNLNYVLIIDEINRANISRVFGELITLIEPDKRSHGAIPLETKLPSGDPFIVPSNLFIIGTMNTADKSIALLDIALRRRFEFESMYPKYSEDGIEVKDENVLKSINQSIIDDKGHDFQIGHSYFMDSKEDPYDFKRRMNVKVIPLLLEYFMNDAKVVTQIISKALNDTSFVVEANSWPLKISAKND